MPRAHITFEFLEFICLAGLLGKSFELRTGWARDLIEIQEFRKIGTLDPSKPILYTRQLGLRPSKLIGYILAGEVRTPTQATQLVR